MHDNELPLFESTPEEILKNCQQSLEQSPQKLKSLAQERALQELDDLDHAEDCLLHRHYFLQNVHPDAKIREAARNSVLKLQAWMIERSFDESTYTKIKNFKATNPRLNPEASRYLEEVLKDYKLLGMELPKDQRERVKASQKELSELENQFSSNIQEYSDAVWVEESELEGLDSSFVSSLQKNEAGQCRVSLDYPEYLPVMEFAKSEGLRKRLFTKKHQVALNTNATILQKMLEKRYEIAKELGYPSWNHLSLEKKMAQKPERVFAFLEDLEKQLQTQTEKEKGELRDLKRELTGDPRAELQIWDVSHYLSLMKQQRFQVDSQKLREYFPLESVLQGLFSLIEKLFSLKILGAQKGSFYQWAPEVDLYHVFDESTSKRMGSFYLDLHPREGKYGHAAAFSLLSSKTDRDGQMFRPVSAMVCNFSKSRPEKPSLLSHREVETLFHEFGHILHGVLSKTEFHYFSGTRVARDFVEAPSQVLENWAWEYEVLKDFAQHYARPEEKIPSSLVDKLNKSKRFGTALFYQRQLSFALADMHLHQGRPPEDASALVQKLISESFLPLPEKTNFAAGWGHLVGYASGYYGYAWADVMAADLFSLFKAKGVINAQLGAELRREIYETGGAREENKSLEAFLRRPLSSSAFLESLGL